MIFCMKMRLCLFVLVTKIKAGAGFERLPLCVQDSENGGDSGYPSERRSEGDPNDHADGVTAPVFTRVECVLTGWFSPVVQA